MLIDTHCHLDDAAFVTNLQEILSEARDAGITRIVVPGIHPEGWNRIFSLAQTHAQLLPTVGIHPMHAELCDDAALAMLEYLSRRAVAIGEIGLDYTIGVSRAVQVASFRAQLKLAVTAGLPVLIHCRKAFQDTLTFLREERVQRVGGVMHAFSGSMETALEFIKLGFYISISGTVTWQNAVKPIRVASSLPMDCLLLETDAPDLTPEPFRGFANKPAYLMETARKLAELRNMTFEEVAEITTTNAAKLFHMNEGLLHD